MNKKEIISFLIRHPDYFLSLISSNYPFSSAQLLKYKKELKWSNISANENINWTPELIAMFSDSLDWYNFTINPKAFKTIDLLDTFSDRIDWKGEESVQGDSITANSGLPWSLDFIKKIESKIDIEKLSYSNCIPWSEQIIDNYKTRLDLVELGCNESVPWTLYLFEKYLDTSYFYCNPLKGNRTLLGNFDFVEKYKDSLDWQDICSNDILPWFEKDLLNYWSNSINWSGIAQNELFFIRDKRFFQNNITKWEHSKLRNFENLSCNKSLPWSKEFIEEYKECWNWEYLSANEGIPWSAYVIDFFSDNLMWGGWMQEEMFDEFGNIISFTGGKHLQNGLVLNTALPWSIDFLNNYESNLEFEALSLNHGVWVKAFKPYLDDDIVETTLRII